jgi:hypothetical protein
MADLKNKIDIKDIDLEQFDAVLVLDGESINEAGLGDLMGNSGSDTRANSAIITPQIDRGAYSQYLNYQDPKIYASWSFGRQLQNQLNGMGAGFAAEVADFGRYVSAKVTYSNPPTGKTASKVFLVVFEPDGKKGNIFQTSNRYRTFSGVGQAASYIKSCVSSLRDKTN